MRFAIERVSVAGARGRVLKCASEERLYWEIVAFKCGVPDWRRTLAVNLESTTPRLQVGLGSKVVVGAEQHVFVLDATSGEVVSDLVVQWLRDFVVVQSGLLAVSETEVLVMSGALKEVGREEFPDVIAEVRWDGTNLWALGLAGAAYSVPVSNLKKPATPPE